MDSKNLCAKHYGETFVTEDGKCCDLVLGHYERIMDLKLGKSSDLTSGEIYSLVISKERENFYDGMTIQVVPHITEEIKKAIVRAGENSDIVLVELGGTVGDIEVQPYIEAIRQLKCDLAKNSTCYIHISLVTTIDVSGEQKTKPTQHSVKELQKLGIQPDLIVCRSDNPLDKGSKSKLGLFCNVDKECIIENIITPNIYDVVLRLEKENMCRVVLDKLKLDCEPLCLKEWEEFCDFLDSKTDENPIRIGIFGKYSYKEDVNMSLRHALNFSAAKEKTKIEIVPLYVNQSFACEKNNACVNQKNYASIDEIPNLDGIIFGDYDKNDEIEYKKAFDFAIKNDIPTLAIGESAAALTGAKKERKTALLGQKKLKCSSDSVFSQLFGEHINERFCLKVEIDESNLSKDFVPVVFDEEGKVAAWKKTCKGFVYGILFRAEFSARPLAPHPFISFFLRQAALKYQ
jgi:CTP synthase